MNSARFAEKVLLDIKAHAAASKKESLVPLLSLEEKDNIKAAFRILDRDGSGSISADEVFTHLKNYYTQHGQNRSNDDIAAEVEGFMTFHDIDKGGDVNFEEFREIEALLCLKKRGQGLACYLNKDEFKLERIHFRDYDKNNDGSITVDEARYCLYRRYSHLVERGMLSEEKLKQVVQSKIRDLAKGDLDGDGRITWEEFIEVQALYLLSERTKQIHQAVSGIEHLHSILSSQQIKEARSLFSRFDFDGNGLVDEEELRYLLSKLGFRLPPHQLEMYVKGVAQELVTPGKKGLTFERFLILYNAIVFNMTDLSEFA